MRNPWRRARSAIAVSVVGALTLTGCSVYDAPLPGGPDTGSDPIEVTARFRDVLDLVPNSLVKLDDVDVGMVTGIELDGYVAEVTMDIRDDVELPANLSAQLRQTSLLGEKFVSLEQPRDPSTAALGDGDTIGLDRTGRNPEVEEVFSALALLLNGGGVGQLRSITRELNMALDGRTTEIKSVLTELDTFIGGLDDNRDSIIRAIENTNRLAENARAQQTTIENALDDVPPALRSLERQREDLVRLLEALTRLSDVGTRVIRESKDATIASLEDLGPVLEGLADAGDALPDSINVFLTYPFIDEAVGRDPQVARNLRMGDYTNLSVDLNLELLDLLDLPELPDVPVPPVVCDVVAAVGEAGRRFDEALDQVETESIRPLLEAIPADILPRDEIDAEVGRIRGELERNRQRLLDEVAESCRAGNLDQLDVAEVVGALRSLLDGGGILTRLDILNPRQLQRLLDGTLGDGGAVGDLLPRGNGGNGGDDGLIGGLLNRAAPAYDVRQIDPFDIGRYGLDPGVGTLLLQGVATQR